MSAAQLCHIEKSRNTPSLRTLRRIAEALEISLAELASPPHGNETCHGDGLVDPEKHLPEMTAVGRAPVFAPAPPRGFFDEREPYSRFRYVHAPAFFPRTEQTSHSMAVKMRDYLELEERTGVPVTPSFSFVYPTAIGEGQGEVLARLVRTQCGLGLASSFDSVGFFENKGIRVIVMNLPEDWSSWSLYDDKARNAVIFLQKKMVEERRQFRVASEIAHVIRFVTNGLAPLPDSAEERRFAREFASAFLLPEEVLRETAYHLGRDSGNWTLPLLLQVKQRFGVTAEVLAYRLEAIGLVSSSLRASFVSQLRDYYKHHSPREPNPTNRHLHRHSRFSDLKLLEKESKRA